MRLAGVPWSVSVFIRCLGLCAVLSSCSARSRDLDPSVFRYDRDLPLKPAVSTIDTLDGYARAPLSYDSPVEGRVAAELFMPLEGASGPAPAIIFLHGLPGHLSTMAPLAAAYARAGVIGLSLLAPFNREDIAHRKDVVRLIPAPLFNEYDRPEMIQVVKDVSRAIDLLAGDPRVDPDRIAYVGFSYGGAVGALMAAVEPRLRAVALMSPSSGLATWARTAPDSHIAMRFFLELPEDTRTAWLASMDSVEPWRYLAVADLDTPILIQAGDADAAIARADLDQLIRVAGERATVRWYESGHALPPAAQADQARFLAAVLGFDADGFVQTARPIR